ncbi:MAG TPA: hypothetical protein DCM28_19620 [Phycisphaerales bacterium]|nr:hypothetical protein [Phycisphaerales bacterium]
MHSEKILTRVLNPSHSNYTHVYMTSLSCTSQATPVDVLKGASQSPAMVLDELVMQAMRGDQDSRNKLLRFMQDRWFRFAVANTGCHDMAMEATQETALRVLEQLQRFEGQSTFSTWSLGIALNVCRELKRKAARQNRRSLLRLTWFKQTESVAHPVVEQAEHLDLLHKHLAELSDRQREAISLRYFEHCTTQQTAELMGVSTGTVKATLSQAISQLRRNWSD